MMEFGTGVEEEATNSQRGKKSYHRHTAHQIQRLENFFKECPHPDENQRKQLGRELGLEPRQIKFWFQNKRTQTKTQSERADNTALRMENEKIQCENLLMRESLKNIICPACGGPPFGDEDSRRSVQQLQIENTHLKDEHEKVSNLLAKCIGKPIPQIQALAAGIPVVAGASSMDLSTPVPSLFVSPGAGINSMIGGGGAGPCPPPSDVNDQLELLGNFTSSSTSTEVLPYQLTGISDVEKSLMVEAATSARDELIRLIRVNEPLWIKSSMDHGNKYILHQDSYEKIFPRGIHSKGLINGRTESSKEWCLVPFNGNNLFDMFWDPNKWVDLFPTIVTKARTIQVIESGIIGSLGGSLQLMYEQMHILSPNVPPREFFLLRYCQQMEPHLWLIVDVSFDCYKESQQHLPPSRSWKFPSGCMIEQLPNGNSKVTWVEHVEVDDRTLTHRLYRNLMSNCLAFGAERWVLTLQRMCERFTYLTGETTPTGGVIATSDGKRSIMNLAHRMVKNFCANLHMPNKLDFPPHSELSTSGVRISLRKNVESGQPNGMIVSASSSLWLPLLPQIVFNYFTDETMRHQWDVLSNGNPVQEIARIVYGSHPGNHISVIRPFVPTENNLMMLQESCMDPLGSLVIYAPIDLATLNIALNGGDSSGIPILPSGFIISSDGRSGQNVGGTSSGGAASTSRSPTGGGTLLTVTFQVLLCSLSSTKQLNMESVATVNTLVSTTIQRIKAALGCSGALDS